MPEFCTCGAHLPPDARFCHKCGKPQYDYPEVTPEPIAPAPVVVAAKPAAAPEDISFRNRAAVRTGLMGAVIAVLLSNIPLPFPLLRLLVAFLFGGFFAVFLYRRATRQNVTVVSGARIGWITGVFSFLILGMLLTLGLLVSSSEGGILEVLRKQMPQNSQTDLIVQTLQDPMKLAICLLAVFFMLFIVLTVLPTVGGALGAKMLPRQQGGAKA